MLAKSCVPIQLQAEYEVKTNYIFHLFDKSEIKFSENNVANCSSMIWGKFLPNEVPHMKME
jgi:hypothetical protein